MLGGPGTRWIWAGRPLEQSIASLASLNWWPEADRIQTTLMQANQAFLKDRDHLRIDYADSLEHPAAQIERIIDYLGIQPSESQIRDAIKLVIKKDPAPLAVAKQAGCQSSNLFY